MKKVLIVETSVYHGTPSGGSFIQADYYRKYLCKYNYDARIYVGHKKNRINNLLRLTVAIHHADYILGFGTPLLDIYLQWLCFFLGKKGVFVIDTLIVPQNVIIDHYQKKILTIKIFFIAIEKLLHNAILMKMPPLMLKLKHLVSCRYIQIALKNTFIRASEEMIFYPNICMKKKGNVSAPRGNTKNILFYGMMYRGRGVIDLLHACQILWKKGHSFKLLVLGFPVDRLTLKRFLQVKIEDKKNNILLLNKVRSPVKYLRQSSVVVLPFRYPCSFQTPLTLLEPMFLGVPVITTDVGSHNEWVKDNETGFICKRENPEDLAEKIEIIFNNKTLVSKISRQAKSLLEKRYQRKDLILGLLKRLSNE